MQRIAVLLLCLWLGGSSASADTCDAVGDVVAGFAGAATGYGLVTNLGAATNWVSAGLYGAGITVAGLGGNAVGEVACENFSDIVFSIADIYCVAGEYVCDTVNDVTMSLYRDLVICSACRWDDVFGAFLLDDVSRENHLRWMQQKRGGTVSWEYSVLPRDQVGPLGTSVLDSYFIGQQAGYDLLRSTSITWIQQ